MAVVEVDLVDTLGAASSKGEQREQRASKERGRRAAAVGNGKGVWLGFQ
jgi:hypothetical protein